MSFHQPARTFTTLNTREVLLMDVAPERLPVMGEAAVPDLPAAVGWMIVAPWIATFGILFATFGHARDSAMMVVVSALFATMYLTVPAIFLRQEPRVRRHVTFAEFLRVGIDTHTGHLSARSAVIQIMTIPVAIASAVAGICTVIAVA